MGYETSTKRLEAGDEYYVVLDHADDSFKYTLTNEEQGEYSISLQKGKSLSFPWNILRNGRWIDFDHAASSNIDIIRIDGQSMILRNQE